MTIFVLLSFLNLIASATNVSSEVYALARTGIYEESGRLHQTKEHITIINALLSSPTTSFFQKKDSSTLRGYILHRSLLPYAEAPILYGMLEPLVVPCTNRKPATINSDQSSLRSAFDCAVAGVQNNALYQENIKTNSLSLLHSVSLLTTKGSLQATEVTTGATSLLIIAGGDITIDRISTPHLAKLYLISGTGRISVKNSTSAVKIYARARSGVSLPPAIVPLTEKPSMLVSSIILGIREKNLS